jgi:hypothetical protein
MRVLLPLERSRAIDYAAIWIDPTIRPDARLNVAWA